MVRTCACAMAVWVEAEGRIYYDSWNNISLVKSIEEASDFVGEFIPVKNFETNQYVGSINESDLFRAYLNLQNQVLFVEKDTNNWTNSSFL